MDYGISTYAAGDFFSEMFTAFSSGWSSAMSFISSNPWLLIVAGTPVILGVLGAVLSFIRSR